MERTNKNFVHVIVFTFIFTNANPSCLTDFSFGFNPSRLLFIISFLDVLVCYQPTKLHSAKNKRNRNQFLFCRQSFNHDHPTLIFFKYYTVTHMLNTLNKVLGEDIFYQETRVRISPKWKRRMFFRNVTMFFMLEKTGIYVEAYDAYFYKLAVGDAL